MHLHDFLLATVAFFTELIGVLSGFGSSTFFVPAGLYFESFNFILALTAILHSVGNLTKLALFKKHFQKDLIFKLAIPSVLLCGLGAILSNYLNPNIFKTILGFSLIFISVFSLFFKKRFLNFSVPYATPLSALSGFLTGLIGTGGALRGVLLSSLNIEKNSFIFTSSAIDIGGDILRAFIYLFNGYMDWSQWFYIPLLGLSAFLGAVIGKKILNHIPQKYFEWIVTLFIFISGFLLVLSN